MTHTTPYLRHPHLHGDLITFTAADDVWLAPADGGRAWRLTRDAAPVRSPRISPDGTHVAFISTRDHHPEVYAATIDTGEVRRLTYWGASKADVLGWAPDGRLLATTHAVEAVSREQVVHAVSLDGVTERLRYGSAGGIDINSSGVVALTTPPTRPAGHWKRYRGGVAGQLWLGIDGAGAAGAGAEGAGAGGAGGAGQWQRLLPDEPAGLLDPMWVDGRLVISSDRAATFPDNSGEQANLWVFDAGPSPETEPRQLTFQGQDLGYVRDATTDGRRITWHSRGEVFILDSLEAAPRRLEVTLPGSAPAPLPLKPSENLDDLVPDPTGDASAVSWRGKTFWLTHREGPARALVAESGVRTREPVVLGATGRVALVTDVEGEDALEVHAVKNPHPTQRMLSGQLGRVLHLASDPSGDRLAVISHDGWLRLVSLSTVDDALQASVREVHRSDRGEMKDPSFSPDGRYLLWSSPTTGESQMHQIMITDTTGSSEPMVLTGEAFHDSSPAFTPDGRHIVFLSTRTLDPHYDDHEFSLSFTGSVRPWLIPISAADPAPFGPSTSGWPVAAEDQSTQETPPVSPELDAEHAEQRIVAFPVPSAAYRDLRAAKGGLLWIREAEDTGELGTRRSGVEGDKPADQLIRWDFTARKATTLVEKLDSYAVSGDGSRVVVRSGEEVTAVPATRKAEKEDDAEKVTVDLSRLRFTVDRPAEWAQMFEETCRLMRQQFWREDMDGIDWDSVVDRWRPVVAKLRSYDDLVDALWETVGELNTSHAYVMPPENGAGTGPGTAKDRKLGLLGVDLDPPLLRAGQEGHEEESTGAAGWRISRILPSESSEPEARSPLRAAGVDAHAGDVITAVDGQPVDPVAGPNAQLSGAAGKPVELSLRRGPAGGDSASTGQGEAGQQVRRVVVVPLSSEEELRYQDWVRSRREYVARISEGRLGYVHVPDMGSPGWAQLHRDLRLAAECEGIIADVRYNRGGHTSQMVIQRLAKQVVAWATARGESAVETYPFAAPRGPVVLVSNRWSGSDGDIVNAVAQAMELGPVVGERTWGGVIGIDGRYSLVDGTVVTQPKYAFWIQGYGWGVENHGIDPNIEVIHDPGVLFAEEDPQLDRAVAEAFTRLERTPAAVPPPLNPPKNR